MSEKFTVWIYVGEGLGIPGLPHEISLDQAAEEGLLERLEAAIENGAYQPKEAVNG